jgi:type IV pilus assembly protein PilV
MSTGSNLTARRQSGAGLIEVAISLLLLSMGALGLAKMQIGAKRLGFEALQRTEASALAADLLERMRANRSGLDRYQTTGIGEGSGQQLATPTRNCDKDKCDHGQWGDWDLWQWEAAINGSATRDSANAVVGGLVRPIGCVAVNNGLVSLEIAWEGYQALSAGTLVSNCGKGLFATADSRRQLLRISTYIGAQ